MRLIDVLKICILGAFVATIFTGFIFIMQSSNESVYGKSSRNIKKLLIPGEKSDVVENKNGDDDFIDVPKDTEGLQINRPADVKPVELPAIKETTIVKPFITSPITTTTTTMMPTTTMSTMSLTITKTMHTMDTTTNAPGTIAIKVLEELKETSRTPSVHIFYYPWYRSPAFNNDSYVHWNHYRLKPDGSRSTDPADQYQPPGEIGAVQYPLLGPYNSADPAVMEQHMKWLSSAGVDVVSVSWYPKGKADPSGVPSDSLMPALLNMTAKYKMKLNFHLEPYPERTIESIRDDIHYIITNYGQHAAFYRTAPKAAADADKSLPLFYVYDSYTIGVEKWQQLLQPNGSATIRDTELDSLMIGLYVKAGEELLLKRAGFDGLYTYFAAEGFSHGSTMSNWPMLSTFCAKENLLFIPSVGPGYNDTAVRPWNTRNARSRDGGEYYKEHFKMAHTAKADIVSITSFNEWHEGTQIEPAMGMANITGIAYSGYDKGSGQYLQITLEMINAYFTPHHENIPMQIARVV